MTKSNDELKGMPSEIYAFKMIGDLGNCWQDYGCGDYAADSVGAKYVRADLAPTSQWRDISTCPMDGMDVLFLHKSGRQSVNRVFEYEDFKNGWSGDPPVNWQPLPAPPTKDLADAGKEGV